MRTSIAAAFSALLLLIALACDGGEADTQPPQRDCYRDAGAYGRFEPRAADLLAKPDSVRGSSRDPNSGSAPLCYADTNARSVASGYAGAQSGGRGPYTHAVDAGCRYRHADGDCTSATSYHPHSDASALGDRHTSADSRRHC